MTRFVVAAVLMSLVPSGTSQFELSLYVLDYGVVGSATEIWAQPR